MNLATRKKTVAVPNDVVQKLVRARLLVEGDDGVNGAYVEPAHDALNLGVGASRGGGNRKTKSCWCCNAWRARPHRIGMPAGARAGCCGIPMRTWRA